VLIRWTWFLRVYADSFLCTAWAWPNLWRRLWIWAPLLVVLVSTAWGFFVHANLRWRFGPLEWLVATPAFHHWHHTYEQPHNKNYSSMLPWMDRVFGTYHMPKALWPGQYGIEEPMDPVWRGSCCNRYDPLKVNPVERMKSCKLKRAA
jgi:sterol desaturase/sphingolipid hydroxylase (fatty acid hydroxylase superfamily)